MTEKVSKLQQKPPEWVIELINMNSIEGIINLLNKQFPNWIKHISNGYHFKYNFLNRNWNDICENLKCERQKILLVSHISNKDDKDQKKAGELAFVCDFLTQKGFVIRRDIELIKCKNSNLVYPCKELYNEMRKRKLSVPHVWEKL